MKRTFFLVITALAALSCSVRPSKQGAVPVGISEIARRFSEAISDASATWVQVRDATMPFADSIAAAALDSNDTKRRVNGQKTGYLVMDDLLDKYLAMAREGRDVSEADLERIVDVLNGSIRHWFYDPDEKRPTLWKDHYYASNNSAEYPVDGYFHLIVDLPTEEHPAPSLYIFFPQSAEKDPYLIFRESTEETAFDENLRKEDVVLLPDWHRKNENNDGFPMFAGAGPEVIDRMLHNAVMYIVFNSEETPEGDPGELEAFRLVLDTFHSSWKAHAE